MTVNCHSSDQTMQPEDTPDDPEKEVIDTHGLEVLSVEVTGEENNYTFHVEIQSPDTGCDQYADWWEVIDTRGNLLYRRVLLHSHVNEQPFTRSGGPVAVASDSNLMVRGHMNNNSYSTSIIRGSVSYGFEPDTIAADFALDLEEVEPLPEDCDF